MSNEKKGLLFIVSGASGTGKTTLCRELEKQLGLRFSVSATTRPVRAGEIEGRDYYFLSREEFDKMVKEGKFLEWAFVHGNYYGTPRGPLEEYLKKGEDVLLDVDPQGAFAIKKRYPSALLIFLKPPSLGDLRRRLQERGTDAEDTIEKRIRRAEEEIAQSDRYDYRVVNQDLSQARQDLIDLLTRLRSQKKT